MWVSLIICVDICREDAGKRKDNDWVTAISAAAWRSPRPDSLTLAVRSTFSYQ